MAIKVVLLKPLDGRAIGSRMEISQADYNRLLKKGAVKKAPAPANKKAPASANKSAATGETK